MRKILSIRLPWSLRLVGSIVAGTMLAAALPLCAQTSAQASSPASTQQEQPPQQNPRPSDPISTQDFNRRLDQLRRSAAEHANDPLPSDYRIGAQDVLDVNVFEATELNRSLRVSASGEITMPLIGAIQVSGLTARQTEKALEEKLRVYMNDPHVGVVVTGVESHPISVLGAVTQPGVFQVRGPKTLLEMLSMAQGLTDDAGDKVLVMRGAGANVDDADPPKLSAAATTDPASAPNAAVKMAGTKDADAKTDAPPDPPPSEPTEKSVTTVDPNHPNTIQIDLRLLLDSADPRYNVAIYPGDIVKVPKAGIVYVVGSVKKAGGFTIRTNEPMSVLKAMALAEGLDATAAKSRARVIRTDPLTGQRTEIPINLGKILDGKSPDMPLHAADIVFVPKSGGKAALYRGSEAAIATASGVIIFHP